MARASRRKRNWGTFLALIACIGAPCLGCARDHAEELALGEPGDDFLSSPTAPGHEHAAPSSGAALDAGWWRELDARSQEEWAYSVGLQSYVFGLPLVLFERERKRRLDPAAFEAASPLAPAAPLNQWAHLRRVASSADEAPHYVPNVDTLHSVALLELAAGPVILTAPDIPDRYWSVRVVDCYAQRLFHLGTRATHGKGGQHALIGPDWKGKLPPRVVPHRVPYNSLALTLRIGVSPEDDEDLQRARTLQAQFALTSLANGVEPRRLGAAEAPQLRPRPNHSGELAFWKTLAELLAENPPAKEHEAALQLLASIGVVPGQAAGIDALSEPTRRGLARAQSLGLQVLKWKLKGRGLSQAVQTRAAAAVDYLERAASALEGAFARDREEVAFASIHEDGEGRALDGTRAYVLHFEPGELPALDPHGFWSITLLGADAHLVDNALDRFAIGDRTPALSYGADGSLDIYVQHQPPRGHESNWLPAPSHGAFHLDYHVYLPRAAADKPPLLAQHPPRLRAQRSP